MQQEQLPLLQELFVLFVMRRCQDVGSMLTPHLATHHGSVIGAVANSNDRSVINQMRYLLAVMFVSRVK